MNGKIFLPIILLSMFFLTCVSASGNLTSEFGYCSDGLDNDNDTFIDMNDSDCIVILPSTEIDCSNGIDDDGDGLIDYFDKSDCKRKSGGGCPTKWVFNYETGEWFKEDWKPSQYKKLEKTYGVGSEKFNELNRWKIVPGKHCVAVDENGRKMAKPTSPPEDYNIKSIEVIEDKDDEVFLEEEIKKEGEKKGFWRKLKDWIFG